MRHLFSFLAGLWFCATPVFAQDDQTLADIRQELTVLYVEIQKLKRELSTTGAPQVGVGGASTLERVDALEARLQTMTAKIEQLEFRIDSVVRDGTNRIGDLEFRLVELEGGDVSQLGETTTLGGEVTGVSTGPAASPAVGLELAEQERADFERAQVAFESGDFSTAAAEFKRFNEIYPGGPLAVRAELLRGSALDQQGDTREAARAYLAAFSLDQNGPDAPEALFRLGAALGGLQQMNEACVTLSEVSVRFPASAYSAEAQNERQNLNCQ